MKRLGRAGQLSMMVRIATLLGTGSLVACASLLDIPSRSLESGTADAASSENTPVVVEDKDADVVVADGAGSTTDVNTSDAFVGPSENLLPNGTFDSSCDAWTSYNGALTLEANGHAGSGCRVCSLNYNTAFSLDSSYFGVSNPPVGAHYTATMWIRMDSGKTLSMNAHLRVFNSPPYSVVSEGSPTNVAVNDTWQQVGVGYNIESEGQYLSLVIQSATAVGSDICFVVDDITLRRDW